MKQENYGYIYKITNRLNNKIYVGLHKSPVLDESYWGSGRLISAAIKKYGVENFSREILEWCNTRQELNRRERFWIKKLDSKRHGYNISDGGDGGATRIGMHHSEDTKEKIGRKHRGKYVSKEVKSKLSESLKGRNSPLYGIPLTEEHKKKISENRKGKCCGEQHQDFGKHQTRERRERIGKSNSNRIYINNGDATKHVKLEDLQYYLSNGWVVGKLLSDKHKQYLSNMKGESSSTYGTRWINNGVNNKMVKMGDLCEYLQSGWKTGMIRKNIINEELRNEFEPQYDGGAPF